MINRQIIIIFIILEVLALLVSLVGWFVLPKLILAAWLILIVALYVPLGASWPINRSNRQVDTYSAPPLPGSRQRHRLALIVAATAIPVVFIAMNFTFFGYVMRAFFARQFIGNIDCTDSSGYFVMCQPEFHDHLAESAKNQIIREEGFCYSQLASRLDINSGLIEDLIIGYCMYRPPRCASSGPLQSRPSCSPPP